jgi:hypothetical protein
MELTTNIQDCLPFGSVDFTKSTALSSACRRSRFVVRGGKVLQLRTCCLVSPRYGGIWRSVNSTLAKSRYLLNHLTIRSLCAHSSVAQPLGRISRN